MSFTFRPAKRENVPLLIGVAGGTGSGKTMSALRLARGLAGAAPFCVIDTESGRAKAYADNFQPWHHGDLAAPFTPDHYGEAITAADAEGFPVIVVDSASHEHAGDGGLLDMHEAEFQRMGARDAVKMAAWIKPKMEHKRFVSQLLQLRAHLILCFRAEEKIEIVKNQATGKTEIVPKRTLTGLDGWVPICEKNLPYELTASFLLTPDRPGVPKPIKLQEQHRAFIPLDQPLTETAGQRLAEWARGRETEDPFGARTQELMGLLTARGIDGAELIEANRAKHASEPEEHLAWLRRQIEAVSSAPQGPQFEGDVGDEGPRGSGSSSAAPSSSEQQSLIETLPREVRENMR